MNEDLGHGITLHAGDCLDAIRGMVSNSLDSCVTDPPYHLVSIVKRFGADNAAEAKSNGATGVYKRSSAGFMGKQWDGGDIAFRPELWAEVFRVLKPGAHLVAFGGTRIYHRMACAIEDAGFEIRDCLQWIYGSGFPKSHDVSKGIDRTKGTAGTYGGAKSAAHAGWIERGAMRGDEGHEGYQRPWMQDSESVDRAARKYIPADDEAREWAGWGTALKPACEPIVLARKPLSERTVAANVLRWGTGAINVDGCRVENAKYNPADIQRSQTKQDGHTVTLNRPGHVQPKYSIGGRFPANVVHDGSPEVVGMFPETGRSAVGGMKDLRSGKLFQGDTKPNITDSCGFGDSGSAARFFYSAKADGDDRLGSKHPTVKPVDLMQWLVRLVTRKGGTVLDPFAGTGTTGEAAWREGCRAILIEREAEYQADIRRRITLFLAGPDERQREQIKAKRLLLDHGPLFSGIAES